MDGKFSHAADDYAASSGHPDHDACGTGFLVQLSGDATHEVVDRALVALQKLSHRGGVDADGSSGDGAGLLTAIPQRFIRSQASALGIELPDCFALGMLFLTPGQEKRAQHEIEKLATEMELQCLGWREVPIDGNVPGARAAETLPGVWQCFFVTHASADIERQLFLFRKRAEAELGSAVYFCSLSCRTVVYKGLLSPKQLPLFYPDLRDEAFESAFAIFHQRFSTNTQPAWKLAQPFRLLAHNGEINTITGNRRWMKAREAGMRREFGAGPWFRGLEEYVSDSASLDNAVELLTQQGRSPEKALTMLVPAVAKDSIAPRYESDFEPWDGPAALIFSDGRVVGAKLDRNGLRPLRYTRTSDGWLMAGSEAGLLDLEEKEIAERGRLGPGELLLVDIASGQMYREAEARHSIATQADAPRVLRRMQRLPLECSGEEAGVAEPRRLAAALGWTEDHIRFLLEPLAGGKEAIFSMGDDTPPAFISKMRRTIWDYCKQRFAQVTNPPIDPLRESHVMSLETRLGPWFSSDSPVLSRNQLEFLERRLTPTQVIDITFPAAQGIAGAMELLAAIRTQVQWTPRECPSAVILSDRNVSQERASVPVLLAAATAFSDMSRAGSFHVPLIVETAQAIDTHHIALLLAVGASAVRPYLAMQLAEQSKPGGAANYVSAVKAGLRKVLSRMGISTLASYRNAQLFEVIGLDGELCRSFFENAPRWAEARSLEQVLEDYLANHAMAFAPDSKGPADAGLYRYRKQGEVHGTSPDLLRKLHAHVKTGTRESYREYETLAASRDVTAIRDLLSLVLQDPIASSSVEPESAILHRFSAQAMSVGAISPEAHRTLAIAMNRLGARSNTGEGGEDPELYRNDPEAASRIKQVASGRFGVTAEYLVHAHEIEIKMAQGAKPGEGGQLPSAKVTPYIARLRRAVPGMSLISPPPHHDIYSIEDLEQLIHDLRQVNPAARIGVKLVAGAGVGIIAAGVAKAGADVITISGYDGGTGASPLTSIKNTGLPWEFGLRDAHRTLVETGLRSHVKLRVDGGLKFARDVVIAALLGADEFGFGTAALLAIGCVMARQCHLNTCPVGIATQDEALRTRFAGKPEMVMAYFRGIAGEVRELLAHLGVSSLAEIVGRTEFLQPRDANAGGWVRDLLAAPQRSSTVCIRHGKASTLSRQLSHMLYKRSGHFQPQLLIENCDRSIGAELSGELLRLGRSAEGRFTPIDLHFDGVAGQSFGAFLIDGVSFQLSGEANDYVGKALSGGTISIDAGTEASLRGDVLAGNTVLYGATSGELYIAGRAGERFAVRNSGALAVVEGVGEHGCEYMTGGVAVILGPTGINFGSGMTGGLAYLESEFASNECLNPEFVCLGECSPEEEEHIRRVLMRHALLTGSPRAAFLLNSEARLPFLRIQPRELPCSLEQTWAPILERLSRPEIGRRTQPLRTATLPQVSELSVINPPVPVIASDGDGIIGDA